MPAPHATDSAGRPFLNNGDYLRHAVRERDEALPTGAPAPASPLDTSIAIPAALSELAASATDVPYFAPLPPLPTAEELVLAPDRGEMGGKRRKAPHERAGWKEMEEDAQRGEKRLRTAAAAPEGGVEEFVGYEAVPAGESLAAVAEAAEASAEAATAEGEDDKRKPRAKLRWVRVAGDTDPAARSSVPNRTARRSKCSAVSVKRR